MLPSFSPRILGISALLLLPAPLAADPVNYLRDITQIASICVTSNVMLVNPAFPAKTVPEFLNYVKANPGKINYASAGIGTGQHLCGELLKMMTGIEMLHVPYRGGAPAIADLLGGQVQVMFEFMPSSIEYVPPAGCMRWP